MPSQRCRRPAGHGHDGQLGGGTRRSPNILMIVADDVGVEMLAKYDPSVVHPHAPTIAGLADQGVVFRNAWSNPLCAVTRATIMTGRYGVSHWGPQRRCQPSLCGADDPRGAEGGGSPYKSAVIGKWGMGGNGQDSATRRRACRLRPLLGHSGRHPLLRQQSRRLLRWPRRDARREVRPGRGRAPAGARGHPHALRQ